MNTKTTIIWKLPLSDYDYGLCRSIWRYDKTIWFIWIIGPLTYWIMQEIIWFLNETVIFWQTTSHEQIWRESALDRYVAQKFWNWPFYLRYGLNGDQIEIVWINLSKFCAWPWKNSTIITIIWPLLWDTIYYATFRCTFCDLFGYFVWDPYSELFMVLIRFFSWNYMAS